MEYVVHIHHQLNEPKMSNLLIFKNEGVVDSSLRFVKQKKQIAHFSTLSVFLNKFVIDFEGICIINDHVTHQIRSKIDQRYVCKFVEN